MNNVSLLITKRDQKYLDNWNKKTKNIKDCKVIFITNNLVDIFLGPEWSNQVRIYLNHKEKSFSFSDAKHRNDRHLQNIITKLLPELLG